MFHEVVDRLEVGAIEEALKLAEHALQHASDRDATLLRCVRANALVATGEPFQALKSADEAHATAIKLGEPLVLAEAKQSLAHALQALDKHALAIELATDCEQLSRENGDPEMLARSWRALGISMSVLGRHALAIDYLTRALELFEEQQAAQSRVLHARFSLLNARSRALSAQIDGEQNDAFATLCEDWERFAQLTANERNTRLYAMALGNVAISARRAGRLQHALEQFRLALALQQRLHLRTHVANTECHIGNVLAALGQTEDALAAFERGIALNHDGYPRQLVDALAEYSALLEKSGRVSEALAALKRSREVEKALDDEAGHAAVTRIERDNEIAKLSLAWARLAEEDALTGLPNRRALDRHLAELVDRSGTQSFALCILDIDFFKQINDTFGHDVGDEVLKRVGQLIRAQKIAASLCARIGGEEFAILITGQTPIATMKEIEALLQSLRANDWSAIAQRLSVSASAGLVISSELEASRDGVTASSLMKCADERLYKAKRGGRDRVCGE